MVPQIPELNIRSADFITAASAIKNGNARFILQALIEEPPKGKNIADQAQTFLAGTAECANLTEDEMNYILEYYLYLYCFHDTKYLLEDFHN